MNPRNPIFWRKWLRDEKKINEDIILYMWLKNTMEEEEIEALKEAVKRYHPDLIVKVSKNNSGTVERNNHE